MNKNKDIPIGLTLSRDLMPQIKDTKKFIKHLKTQGVEYKKKKIDPNTLKASQSEFDDKKIAKLTKSASDKPIITSKDNHVADGHHRWIADKISDRKTSAYQVNLPILDLLHVAKHYEKTIAESAQRDDIIDRFSVYVCDQLGISKPPIISIDNELDHSFGGYLPSTNQIKVTTKHRHIMDVLRTIAHELVHHKQNEDGRITDVAKNGATGSPIEDEANYMAGRLMRNWAKANPDHFKLSKLTEKVAVFVVGGPCSGKDKIIKSLKEEYLLTEYDAQSFNKKVPSLQSQIIVNGSSEKDVSHAISHLIESGYHSSMVFVDVDNATSKLRNEARIQKGQRVLSESVRQQKFDEARQNMETYKLLFREDMTIVDNSNSVNEAFEKELKSKPKDREWGTKSLTKIYRKMTPGQTDNSGTQTFSNDGVGATWGTPAATGGAGAYSVPIYEWLKNPKTIERFQKRYGNKAMEKMHEVAAMFEQNNVIRTPKSLSKIRESFDKGLLDRYGTVPNQNSEEMGEDSGKRTTKLKYKTKNKKQ